MFNELHCYEIHARQTHIRRGMRGNHTRENVVVHKFKVILNFHQLLMYRNCLSSKENNGKQQENKCVILAGENKTKSFEICWAYAWHFPMFIYIYIWYTYICMIYAYMYDIQIYTNIHEYEYIIRNCYMKAGVASFISQNEKYNQTTI